MTSTLDPTVANAPLDPIFQPSDTFPRRHLGVTDAEVAEMLKVIGFESVDALIDATVPAGIRSKKPLKIGRGLTESELLAELKKIAGKNKVLKSLIGQGYHDTIVPPVILRNILENPGWYTQYTPYQAEISQGRMEALLNFQTVISDLTALPLANASLLDEGTAAAEAMAMCVGLSEGQRRVFFVDHRCHPQTIAVVRTRGESMGVEIRVVPISNEHVEVGNDVAGVLVQYPTTDGAILDYAELAENVHKAGSLFVVAADLLALTLIKAPGEFGADIAVGSAQRFGVPMGFGGPHAGLMATKNEYARKMPGRLIGVSKDAHGNPALRLTLQTREQHIRRERATSNICTAQVLLAIMAGMYAVYHGPEGLKQIARRTHAATAMLARGLIALGHSVGDQPFFDTVKVRLADGLTANEVISRSPKYNFRKYDDQTLGISLDEVSSADGDLMNILTKFRVGDSISFETGVGVGAAESDVLGDFRRTSEFLTHPNFSRYHTEHELLRYIKRLEAKDLSLCHSMIPLGSCTMKLNATTEMIPVTWPEFGKLHPFAPADQWKGYAQLFKTLEKWLCDITGFAACSLQPNAGSQGEYAGLLAIRGYMKATGHGERDICLIPTSAHGTNPASAVIAGFKVVAVKCDADGNIDLADLKAKADEHSKDLACLMITYPSTHGVFEEGVKIACKIVHDHGGKVYMDGANMNAQVGLTSPGLIGADVCHLNLHKTFCIPHGGGGPGMGPICCTKQLAPYLPHTDLTGEVVSAAPYGSASILPISYAYIAMMGSDGLKRATEIAILNANYMAKRLEGHYPILYRGKHGTNAHEFVVDCRAFEKTAGVKVEDIAKRLMDFGFHAPTMSWPVPGTLMIEPTESESKAELDRLVDALIVIREEIRAIEEGRSDMADNALKHAPHTAAAVSADAWPHAYSRQQAAYPAAWVAERKFWPSVGRVDNVFGDRNLVCSCPPMSED